MCVKTFGYSIGEEAEIYLALYDSEAGKFLTDRFWIQVTKNSFANCIDKFQPYCTVFTVRHVHNIYLFFFLVVFFVLRTKIVSLCGIKFFLKIPLNFLRRVKNYIRSQSNAKNDLFII